MTDTNDIDDVINQFREDLQPFESGAALAVFSDNRTGARYCECHVRADKLVSFSTIDAPLDPESQAEYKGNRELLTDAPAFSAMKDDALKGRSFSNLVAEYSRNFGPDKPLKIIGGQHRYEAIRLAADKNVNEWHGVKVYFGLATEQRMDVAVISNRNLAISGALLDRYKETARGGAMRDWCQAAGLLKANQDLGDKTARGGAITANLVRTFVHNFYLGKEAGAKQFDKTDTTPFLYQAGKDETTWDEFLLSHPDVWKHPDLLEAGKEFAKLRDAQREAFAGEKGKSDFAEKAMNAAVLSAWAYTAGLSQSNKTRLKRLYALPDTTSGDPLNAQALSEGKHKSDSDTYRGLGQRTDARERGQMVELFAALSESGDKVTPKKVKSAIYDWHAKRHILAAIKLKEQDDG